MAAAEFLRRTGFVTLTEYVTWKLDGVPRTPAELVAVAQQQLQEDWRRWGGDLNALRSHIALLASGKRKHPSTDGPMMDQHLSDGLAAAKRWLESRELTAAAALGEIDSELAVRGQNARRFAELWEHVNRACQSGTVALIGRRADRPELKPQAEYEQIDRLFFARRREFSPGTGYAGLCEITAWSGDSEQEIMDSIFDRDSRTRCYVMVKIDMDDVRKLEGASKSQPPRRGEHANAAATLERGSAASLKAVYEALWPTTEPPGMSAGQRRKLMGEELKRRGLPVPSAKTFQRLKY